MRTPIFALTVMAALGTATLVTPAAAAPALPAAVEASDMVTTVQHRHGHMRGHHHHMRRHHHHHHHHHMRHHHHRRHHH
ncbi:hypothetical protein [Methylobacterium isbiliense]|uniref:hypothetical protein n=1 Tax=Methylobacterium isbiliense TaxID=315478 RepID=UPI001EE32D1A|nr:hypothetical protein [Methylobacterium isbiliense]MDN3625850.1 hypothetical protein [Methylobacterium isbiliense]